MEDKTLDKATKPTHSDRHSTNKGAEQLIPPTLSVRDIPAKSSQSDAFEDSQAPEIVKHWQKAMVMVLPVVLVLSLVLAVLYVMLYTKPVEIPEVRTFKPKVAVSQFMPYQAELPVYTKGVIRSINQIDLNIFSFKQHLNY
jgi:hypothetical protein